MDEPPEEATGESPYLKLPWPMAAGGIAVVLLLVLGAGLYANRYLRPQTAIQPPATAIVAVAAPPATPQPATPTLAPATATPQQAIAPVTATQTPLPRPTPNPTAASAPATSTPVADTSSTPSIEPTVDPTLAAEVGRAYENYWRVVSQALLQLDTSQLPLVMDGDRLVTATRLIDQLRTEGRAIQTQVTLNYVVAAATVDSASVIDRYEDHSFYVKAGTEEPLSQPATDELHVLYRMQRSSGEWKVVDSVREQ